MIFIDVACFVHLSVSHYENMSMQYTEIFKVVKIENFSRNSLKLFLFLLKT